jgi:hypothetical protein
MRHLVAAKKGFARKRALNSSYGSPAFAKPSTMRAKSRGSL